MPEPLSPNTEKKLRERQVLDHLLGFGQINAQLVEEREAPDFILALDGTTIGVEVTQYLRGRSASGSRQRRQHAFIQAVLDRGRELLETETQEALYVTIDALDGRANHGGPDLARALADSVRDCLNGDWLPVRPFPFGLIPPAGTPFLECRVPLPLQAVADRITIVRLPAGSSSRWHIRQSGDTKAEVAELEAIIASKERHLARYLQVCDEAWLLIDAFGADILQAITPTHDLVGHRYRTGFSRVFLVDTTETTLHQMWTSHPGGL